MKDNRRYKLGMLLLKADSRKISRYKVVAVNYRAKTVTVRYRGVHGVDTMYRFDEADKLFKPLAADSEEA